MLRWRLLTGLTVLLVFGHTIAGENATETDILTATTTESTVKPAPPALATSRLLPTVNIQAINDTKQGEASEDVHEVVENEEDVKPTLGLSAFSDFTENSKGQSGFSPSPFLGIIKNDEPRHRTVGFGEVIPVTLNGEHLKTHHQGAKYNYPLPSHKPYAQLSGYHHGSAKQINPLVHLLQSHESIHPTSQSHEEVESSEGHGDHNDHGSTLQGIGSGLGHQGHGLKHHVLGHGHGHGIHHVQEHTSIFHSHLPGQHEIPHGYKQPAYPIPTTGTAEDHTHLHNEVKPIREHIPDDPKNDLFPPHKLETSKELGTTTLHSQSTTSLDIGHDNVHKLLHDHKKKAAWKGLAKFLATIIPIGLLFAALQPNVVVVNATEPPRRPLRPLNSYRSFADSEALSEYESPECEQRQLCDIIAIAGLSGPVEPTLAALIERFPDMNTEKNKDMFKSVYKRAKEGQCSYYYCPT